MDPHPRMLGHQYCLFRCACHHGLRVDLECPGSGRDAVDHDTNCFRYDRIEPASIRFSAPHDDHCCHDDATGKRWSYC
jgi:hypothetical protein